MANTKFKVGDKVKVVKNVTDVDFKDTFIGHIYTIKNIDSVRMFGQAYGIGKNYVVYDNELELVEPNSFTKSDLKDGMVVRTRDKGNFLVLGDVLLDDYEKINLDNYKSDLIHNASPILDIMAVYSVQTCAVEDIYDTMCVDNDCHKLIWERKEEPKYKEMTVDEIEEKLGYKIKVVGND
jgi:hypothetical protein